MTDLMKDEIEAAQRVAAYYLDQAIDDTRPLGVLLDLCKIRWPDKTFALVDPNKGDDGLYYLDDIADETGTNGQELLASERAAAIMKAKDAEGD